MLGQQVALARGEGRLSSRSRPVRSCGRPSHRPSRNRVSLCSRSRLARTVSAKDVVKPGSRAASLFQACEAVPRHRAVGRPRLGPVSFFFTLEAGLEPSPPGSVAVSQTLVAWSVYGMWLPRSGGAPLLTLLELWARALSSIFHPILPDFRPGMRGAYRCFWARGGSALPPQPLPPRVDCC